MSKLSEYKNKVAHFKDIEPDYAYKLDHSYEFTFWIVPTGKILFTDHHIHGPCVVVKSKTQSDMVEWIKYTDVSSILIFILSFITHIDRINTAVIKKLEDAFK
jgi:hypothetical protein